MGDEGLLLAASVLGFNDFSFGCQTSSLPSSLVISSEETSDSLIFGGG